MPKSNWERLRIDLIEKTDKLFLSKIQRLQSAYYAAVRDYLDTELVIHDKSIRAVSSNYSKINELHLIEQRFKVRETNKLIKWIIRRYVDILNLNRGYFNDGFKTSLEMNELVRSELLARIGVKVKLNKITIVRGGWADSLTNLSDPYLKVREVAVNAVAEGMKYEEFRSLLKKTITAPGVATIKHHFYTNAYDSFSRFDRLSQQKYAEEIGILAFRWSGGIIKNTREFPCKKYNGKVLVKEEYDALKDKQWKGKNKDYVPMRDLGGHNCRHVNSGISEQKAIRNRPDLKEYYRLHNENKPTEAKQYVLGLKF